MKRFIGTITAACGVFLAVQACRCGDPAKARGSRPVPAAPQETPAVLATLPEEDEPAAESPPSGLGLHAPLSTGIEFFFSERGGGVAYAVEKGAGFQVVHNGRPGRPYEAVGTIALSPDGRRCAHGALVEGTWRMVVDGVEGQGFAAVQSLVFSPDGAHVAYQAMASERWHLVVDATVSVGTRTRYLGQEFSGDSTRIAFIDDADDQDAGRLVVSDLAFKTLTVVDPHASGLLVNADRTGVAATSATGGKQQVLTFDFDRPESVRRGGKYDKVNRPVFSPDGGSLAYVAERAGQRSMVLDDKVEPIPPADMVDLPAIRPDNKAVGVFVVSGGAVSLHQFFAAARAGETPCDQAEGLTYSADGRTHAYAARRGESWFVVAGGQEGPAFDRVVSPAFSPDGKFLVYRARKDGQRFVVVADPSGKTIRHHPAYQQVFPVRFTADGKSVAYGVKDGRRLAWKVEAL
jgi:WD40-like Beta Propeller Repeat